MTLSTRRQTALYGSHLMAAIMPRQALIHEVFTNSRIETISYGHYNK